jgi:hypothetical protein
MNRFPSWLRAWLVCDRTKPTQRQGYWIYYGFDCGCWLLITKTKPTVTVHTDSSCMWYSLCFTLLQTPAHGNFSYQIDWDPQSEPPPCLVGKITMRRLKAFKWWAIDDVLVCGETCQGEALVPQMKRMRQKLAYFVSKHFFRRKEETRKGIHTGRQVFDWAFSSDMVNSSDLKLVNAP